MSRDRRDSRTVQKRQFAFNLECSIEKWVNSEESYSEI